MIGMLVLAAQLGTNIFVPRFGPKVLVPIGMTLGVIGMIWLTRLDASTAPTPRDVLPPLMVIGFAMGTIMPASMQTATLGVDRQFAGVASAMVNTSQQVGGSIGTALLNTLAATATDRLPRGAHARSPPRSAAEAAMPATRPRTGGAPGSSPSARCSRRCCSAVAARASRSRTMHRPSAKRHRSR